MNPLLRLAFYPGFGLLALLDATIRTSAPITMFLADHDEEVSPAFRQHVAARSPEACGKIEVTTYAGDMHDFDDPGEKRQKVPDNAVAKANAMAASVVDGLK